MNQFEADILKATLTSMLNVYHYDTMELLFNIHYRMEHGKAFRNHFSFQVLNAYDLFVRWIDVFIHDYSEYARLRDIEVHYPAIFNQLNEVYHDGKFGME